MKTIKQSKAAKKQQAKEAEAALKAYIIKRDGSICQKCGKYVEGRDRQLSHIISRAKAPKLVYNEWNVKILCNYCHLSWWHKLPYETKDWLDEKYPGRYDMLLELNQKTKVCVDLKEVEQYYINKLKELQ